jgi:hypothetical protein
MATVGGGSFNSSSAGSATVSGGSFNSSGEQFATVGGGSFNTNAGDHATIGGGAWNVIEEGAAGAFIGSGNRNRIGVGAFNATLGGGSGNRIAAAHAAIGGGEDHEIGADAFWATISGGADNGVAPGAYSATIGGGGDNQVLSNAWFATIPGGAENTAGGPYSFAAGRAAQALHEGAFVWADSLTGILGHGVPFPSTHASEFSVRATGGVRFVSAADTNGSNLAGVTLTPGSGTWSSLSDRNAKENLAPADTRAILDKLVALPLASWNYKAQSPAIRHLGPMAQDFHAAFGLGENDRTITTVDADGVALAAIQGLDQKLSEELKRRDAENAELRQTVQELKRLIGTLMDKKNEP